MLITFKSDADGDVIMFGSVGQLMLETLGKDPHDARGIITVAQLPEALAKLRAAIEADKAGHPPEHTAQDSPREPGEAAPEPVVHFSQRAAPLLAMLQYSTNGGVPVVWES